MPQSINRPMTPNEAAPWERVLPNVITADTRIPVAVLGATGTVGQTFVRLLADHPWFRLAEAAASSRSSGRAYSEVVTWQEGVIPPHAAALTVAVCDPEAVRSPIVFSALDAGVAGEIEERFARDGRLVLTNARNHRLAPDVPLMIPEVNGDHAAVLEFQRARRGWGGGIVANANCAATVVAMAVAPLHRAFGLHTMHVATMQAVSGAGYPGLASLDILGNVIPHISGEEEKIEAETRKLLGSVNADGVRPLDCRVSAQANRVPVEHGHTACVTAAFDRSPAPDEALDALRNWRPFTAGLTLPSAPEVAVEVLAELDRPQPRRDAGRGGGMTVSVGRVRADPVLDLRLVACGHNTVRGAAGASILNAELLVAQRTATG